MDNVNDNRKKRKRYKLYKEDPTKPIPPSTLYYQKLKKISNNQSESEDNMTADDGTGEAIEMDEYEDDSDDDDNDNDEDEENEISGTDNDDDDNEINRRKIKKIKPINNISKKFHRTEPHQSRPICETVHSINKCYADVNRSRTNDDDHNDPRQPTSSSDDTIDDEHNIPSNTESSDISAVENEVDPQINDYHNADFGNVSDESISDNDGPETTDEEEIPSNIGDVTIEESRLLHLAFALRNNLTDVGMDQQLQLVDCHLPEKEFHSKYKFLQSVPYPKYEVYYYCNDCEIFIQFDENEVSSCDRCSKRYVKKEVKKAGDYFIYVNLKSQIEDFLKSETYSKIRTIPSDISDIVNSVYYREMREKGVIGPGDLTLTWNCDGVQLFKKSSRSMTPLQAMVNELPYRHRRSNMFLIALWMNRRKPIMKLFMRPFVEEMKILSLHGIDSETFTSSSCINTKVFSICSSVDSVARPVLQNIKQYNGKFGCSFCLEEGKRITVGSGTARIYPCKTIEYRSNKGHMKHVEDAVNQKKCVKGVKGPSITQLIPYQDIVFDYPPEYLHGCCLGVGKWFGTEWFNSNNSGNPWYLGLKSEQFNEKLMKIKPPCEITRTPQAIGQNYNGHDWKEFILYYSLPCITNLMPKKYVQHWFLFVLSMNIFLKSKISDAEFIVAEQALAIFVKNIEKLYSERFLTFNVHILRHLPLFVKRYGALWAWSAFPFEHFNGVIRQLFHGTQYVPEQICKMYFRLKYVRQNSHIFAQENCSKRGKKLFSLLMKQCRVKNCIEYGEKLRVFGKAKIEKLSTVQRNLIENLLGIQINAKVKRYDRFIYNNILFHSCNYKRLVKRNNSCIITDDSEILCITGLISVNMPETNGNDFVILGNKYQVLNERLCSYKNFHSNMFSFIAKKTPSQMCIRVESIKTKAVSIPFDGENINEDFTSDYDCRSIIVPLVNNIETD